MPTGYGTLQAESEVKEVQKQLKTNMEEIENYKLLKYVFMQWCSITQTCKHNKWH